MKRARRSFWILAAVAAGAMGVLSRAVATRPSPAAGIAVAASAMILVAALALAVRILVRLEPIGPTAPPHDANPPAGEQESS